MASPSPLAVLVARGDDINRSSWLLPVFWVEASIAIIFVSLRFYTQYVRRSIWHEDWTMLVSLVFFLLTACLCTASVYYGLGHHVSYLDSYQISQSRKWNWILRPFSIMSNLFAKSAITLSILRMLGTKGSWQKWFLYTNLGFFAILSILGITFAFAQCDPPRALWESVPEARCWTPAVDLDWSSFSSAHSAFLDLALPIVPYLFLHAELTQMSRYQTICLHVILGAGTLSAVCAAVKAADFQDHAIRNDITWEAVSIDAWAFSEIFLNIISGTIPILKPLWDYLVNGKPMLIIQNFRNSSGHSIEKPKSSPKSTVRYSQWSQSSQEIRDSLRSGFRNSLQRFGFGKQDRNSCPVPSPASRTGIMRGPVELEEGGSRIQRSNTTRSAFSLDTFILHDR